MTKQDLLEMVEALPEDVSQEGLEKVADELEKLRLIAEIQLGIDELDRGERVHHSEVKKTFDKWLKR